MNVRPQNMIVYIFLILHFLDKLLKEFRTIYLRRSWLLLHHHLATTLLFVRHLLLLVEVWLFLLFLTITALVNLALQLLFTRRGRSLLRVSFITKTILLLLLLLLLLLHHADLNLLHLDLKILHLLHDLSLEIGVLV